MTSFFKCTGAARDQSTFVFLHRVQEQLVGDDERYNGKVGFKDLRQKPTKYSISSHANRQFVVGQASRPLKNNRPPTKPLSQARGAFGINQPVNETGEPRLARIRNEEGLSIPLERLIWAAVRSHPSVRILEKVKARQGSRRAKETPRMATTMN
jgi:hypothetical protein